MTEIVYLIFLLLSTGYVSNSEELTGFFNIENDLNLTANFINKTFSLLDVKRNTDWSKFSEDNPLETSILRILEFQFLLFTTKNPSTPQVLIDGDEKSVNLSNFNPKLQTVVTVHGYLGNQSSDFNIVLRNAFLNLSNVNVIVMDWNQVSHLDYATAVTAVPILGRALGRFLSFLNSSIGAPFDNMHLIGFSLGAHLVGNAGRITGGKIARISGLDPAGPLWYINVNKLHSSDALYVEAIHTNRGNFGLNEVIGQNDFYPCGGYTQPGCSTNACSHSRSWMIFVMTLTKDIYGRKCGSIFDISSASCDGEQLAMGNDELKKSGSGLYRVNDTCNPKDF